MIKKSDEKKLKDVSPDFYRDVLSGKGGFSISDYGLDRRRLGKALGKVLRKTGTWFNTADRYSFMIVNHLESQKLIIEKADHFEAAPNWRDLLKEMFPKEDFTEKAESLAPTVATVEMATQEAPETEATMTQGPVAKGSLKTYYDFYTVLLERIGGDFRTKSELGGLITELWKENTGVELTDTKFVSNRLQILQGNGTLESIIDEGTRKYLRSKDYKKTLESKKAYLSRRTFDLPVTEEKETKPEVTKAEPVKEKQVVVSQPKEPARAPEPTVVINITPSDKAKLFITDTLFEDRHGRCVVEVEAIPANLDVLKNLSVEADAPSKEILWGKLEDQRNYYLGEIAKINRLCGKQ